MSFFDDIRCDYPLPIEGAAALQYQTQSFDDAYLNMYVIRRDGTLWQLQADGTYTQRCYCGEVRFYSYSSATQQCITFSAYFRNGHIAMLECIENTLLPDIPTQEEQRVRSRRQRIITLADLRGDFITSDDGFVAWWPVAGNGSLTATDLRTLADELDRRNAAWQAQIVQDVGGNPNA